MTIATKTDIRELTPKQLHFCRCVAAGMSQAAACREAFDCQDGSLGKTQQEAASRLMARGKIRARVKTLIAARKRGIVASALSDRDGVLTKLRALLDSAEGTAAENVMLRAADLLGKSTGLFKDVVVQEPERSTAELEAELMERLTALLDGPDNVVH